MSIPRFVFFIILQTATAWGFTFDVPIVSLTNHNISAFSAYNTNGSGSSDFHTNFFPPTTIISTASNVFGSGIDPSKYLLSIDNSKMDKSLNPVTPGHVSKMDVHTLLPSAPNVRWFAHATPWFGPGQPHVDIGLNNNTTAYVSNMITDMENRGFNGVVIDWYGSNSQPNQVTLKIQSYLKSIPNNKFSYIVMLDGGIQGGLGLQNLTNNINYLNSQYFSDSNYEHEPLTTGKPILMFFGVASGISPSFTMTTVKNDVVNGNGQFWVEQQTSFLSQSWENGTFQWTWTYDQTNPPPSSDPFNVHSFTNEYPQTQRSNKISFASMCSAFNGTMTFRTGWSLGKYLPGSNGVCLVQRAKALNNILPSTPVFSRVQWATWSDWEEGTEVEAGIENNASVINLSTDSSDNLFWTLAGADPTTVHHYEIYASSDGVNAALIGALTNNSQTSYEINLNQLGLPSGQYSLYVDAVGIACVRDHMSSPLPFTMGLSAPTGVIAEATNAAVNLSWNSVAGATSYTVAVATNNANGPYSILTTVTTNSATVALANGIQYFFEVMANNANGSSAPSSPAVSATPLSTPSISNVQPTNTTVTLTWTASAGATGYEVFYGTTSGGPYPNVLASATTSTTVNNLINGTRYFFIVEGTNANGISSPSGEVSAIPAVPSQTLIPTDYSRSMQITFSGYNRTTAMTNFPVLVELSTNLAGFAYNQFMSPTANDLRFTDPSGNVLNHEIDQWNTNGVSTVWVEVPLITTNTDFITAYWGNRADSNTPAFTTNGSTWPGYLSVMHLKESGFPYADSTTLHPANAGTAPTVNASGQIGSGESFNGTSQFLAPANAVSLGSGFSLSAWVNLSTTSSNIQTLWANKAAGGGSNGVALFVNTFNSADGAVSLETGNGIAPGATTTISTAHAVQTGGWHHVFASANEANGTATVYVDGVNVTAPGTNTIRTDFANNANVTLGSFTNSHWFLNGSMDEARIEPLRTADWVWTTWMTAASNSVLENYGTISLTKVLDQDAFSDAMTLTISGYTGASTLTNFPLLVNLSTNIPGFSYSQFASPTGNDLRFTDASGQILLSHEIDTWNTNGTSSVWVSVPAISSNTNFIVAYWGNSSLTNVAPFTTNGSTWANYSAVFHLRESGLPYLDSTTLHTANSGTIPSLTSAGEIGNAEAFNGSSTFLAPAGTINLGNSFSLSAWVNLSNSATSVQTIWANKPGGATANGVALFVNTFQTTDGELHVESGDGVNGARADSISNAVPANGWHHVFASVDRANGITTLYVDGINVTSTSGTRTNFANNTIFNLARYTNSNFYFNGRIDEARIEPFRSGDWVNAAFLNVASNSSFISYPTVSNPVGAPNFLATPPSQSPQLLITSSGKNLHLNWSASDAQFKLFNSTNLKDWTPVTDFTILPDGGVELPESSGPGTAVFFRLQSQ